MQMPPGLCDSRIYKKQSCCYCRNAAGKGLNRRHCPAIGGTGGGAQILLKAQIRLSGVGLEDDGCKANLDIHSFFSF